MTDSYIAELAIVAISWLVLCVPIWLVLWIVFPKLDRRPKDSVRCRTCWYDLRATSTCQCPECGADLTQTRVWPVGKPNRAKLVHVVMLWFWLGTVGALAATNLLSDNIDDIVQHYAFQQDVVYALSPESETHDFAVLTLNGDGWVFFPDEHGDTEVPVASASIWIYSAGVEVQSVTIDPRTMTFVPHPKPHYERLQEQSRAANNSSIRYGDEATPTALADFYPLGLDAQADRLLLAEMSALLETCSDSASDGPLLRSADQTEQVGKELAIRSDGGGGYAKIKPQSDVYVYNTKRAPLWTSLIVLGVGILIVAGGVFVIRKWCYKRDTVAWEPSATDAAP